MSPDASQSAAIRKARAGDLGAVTGLRLAFLADVRGVAPESFHATFAEQTDTFVRQAYVEPRVREGYIINMYVDPACRGYGVGRALLEACLANAQRLGIRRFNLHATDDARPLYEGVGFTTIDDWLALRVPLSECRSQAFACADEGRTCWRRSGWCVRRQVPSSGSWLHH